MVQDGANGKAAMTIKARAPGLGGTGRQAPFVPSINVQSHGEVHSLPRSSTLKRRHRPCCRKPSSLKKEAMPAPKVTFAWEESER